MSSTRLIAIIGATGAQGIPIVKSLAESGQYTIHALTRDPSNARFKELQAFGPVEAVTGTFASESDLRATFKGAWGAFVNIDGFNSGEKTEMFWTIRAWELAIEEGVKFFVLGNLDYAYKLSGFRPEFRAGHYDGKGRIGDFILAQNKDPAVRSRMRSALFTTSPYMDMTIGKGTPFAPVVEEGVAVWKVPLADGAVPFTALEDCGVYVKWLFDHPDEADGMDLAVAIDHITFNEYVRAFNKVTGREARWENVDLQEHLETVFGPMVDTPTGYNADPNDKATMTLRQNFGGFFTVWRNSGGNKGVIRRDYALLDKIHPDRIRSAEQWFRMENERGIKKGLGDLWSRTENLGHILKITEEGRTGKI
ncbi:hypothetical protein F5Y16DRAFT_401944 [Xylariaceae sp. FL0255]|nr:hypothetical protein F5Y16DRAFT_401944 [Xylariaceae sp. FL0255]